MQRMLQLEQLRQLVDDGTIDTVIVAACDMQGRLMGKRFHAACFIETAYKETHCCNYLLATDMEMHTVPGYSSTGWTTGYGDYVMRPDLSTLRLVPWQPGTAQVMCDFVDHDTHELVAHAPRTILRRQLERLAKLGFTSQMATELEFFVFRENFDELRDSQYLSPTTFSAYNEDYHLLQTYKEEPLMRAIRNNLHAAGIAVENTKGEASAGQAEVNVRYSDAMCMADNHVLIKNAVKEIAYTQNRAVTFMAKWSQHEAGSSSHIHQSLADKKGNNVFYTQDKKYGMSQTMQSYLAGLLSHSAETTLFLAPYINSYKRFAESTFAPTKAVWSLDNRTAGYRVAAANTQGVRVECRIGGSDINPYLALASQLAAGIAGMRNAYTLEAEFQGNAYADPDIRHVPITLREAIDALDQSTTMREAFGDAVIDHYLHAAKWEQSEFDRAVTDYERKRFFERS